MVPYIFCENEHKTRCEASFYLLLLHTSTVCATMHLDKAVKVIDLSVLLHPYWTWRQGNEPLNIWHTSRQK